MRRKEAEWRKFTLRISETLGAQIDKYVNNSGITTQEFIRQACWEKLENQEKRERELREPGTAYYSQEDFNRALITALKSEDIQKIILEIIINHNMRLK